MSSIVDTGKGTIASGIEITEGEGQGEGEH